VAFKSFDRVVSFAPGSGDAKWLEAELAKFAVEQLRLAQRAGEASQVYVRAVNGVPDAPEASVKAPGPIVYSFQWVGPAASDAVVWLKQMSPVRTGRYRRSFIVIADGREVADATAVKNAGVVQVVNTQPYSRKIQVGAKGFESHRDLFEKVRRRVNRAYRGVVTARVVFLQLSDAYVLRKGSGNRRRRDRVAGAALTYPAIELVSETIVN